MTRHALSAFSLVLALLVVAALWSVTPASAAQPGPATDRVTYSRNPDNTWTYQITNALRRARPAG